jgi:hypothetical protein
MVVQRRHIEALQRQHEHSVFEGQRSQADCTEGERELRIRREPKAASTVVGLGSQSREFGFYSKSILE